MGRRLRTHLDLLHPDIAQKVQDKQQKITGKKPPRVFQVDDKVYAKNFHGAKWISAIVSKVAGPLSYQVTTNEGTILRRHVDHLRVRYDDSELTEESEETDEWITMPSRTFANRTVPTAQPPAANPPIQKCRFVVRPELETQLIDIPQVHNLKREECCNC